MQFCCDILTTASSGHSTGVKGSSLPWATLPTLPIDSCGRTRPETYDHSQSLEEPPASYRDLAGLTLPTTISCVRHFSSNSFGSSPGPSTSAPSAAEAFEFPNGIRREATFPRHCSVHFPLRHTFCLARRRWNLYGGALCRLGGSRMSTLPLASIHAWAASSQLSPMGCSVNLALRSGRR
jgi:hypothetical protein